ncbi:hypothetical protein OIG27_11595, partial [Neisseria meningitidis]|uniref:hypothetical protein n=1 Tax=Neisseria meningitidis TaxID=487 RepID=UPI0021F24257
AKQYKTKYKNAQEAHEAVRRSLTVRYTPPQYDTAESLLKSARRARREAAKQMARLYAAQS